MTEFRGDNQVTVYYLPGTMGWESTFGGTPNRYGPSFGTVPTAPWLLPEPRILNNNTNFGVQNGQFGFTISWATNASVVVEACANLDTSAWKSIQTNTLDGGTSYFSDPEWAKYSHRFYRLSLP